MRLQEALETAEQHHGWRLLDPAAWLRQMKFSPALAAALLIVGFASGILTAWRMVPGNPREFAKQLPGVTTTGGTQEASIAGIREIVQDPNSNKVEVKYDTLVAQKYEGSLDDQRIQQLLLYAVHILVGNMHLVLGGIVGIQHLLELGNGISAPVAPHDKLCLAFRKRHGDHSQEQQNRNEKCQGPFHDHFLL
jgi:hypothetical protein